MQNSLYIHFKNGSSRVLKIDKLGVQYFLKVMYAFRKKSNITFLNITHERGSFGCDLSEILYYDITPIDTTNKEE